MLLRASRQRPALASAWRGGAVVVLFALMFTLPSVQVPCLACCLIPFDVLMSTIPLRQNYFFCSDGILFAMRETGRPKLPASMGYWWKESMSRFVFCADGILVIRDHEQLVSCADGIAVVRGQGMIRVDYLSTARRVVPAQKNGSFIHLPSNPACRVYLCKKVQQLWTIVQCVLHGLSYNRGERNGRNCNRLQQQDAIQAG